MLFELEIINGGKAGSWRLLQRVWFAVFPPSASVFPPYAAGPPGNGCLVRCFPIPRRIGYSPITLIARNRHYGPSAPITHSASFPFFSSVFCPRPQRCQKLPQSNRRSPRRCQKLPQSRSFQVIGRY
ncbi:hypothetical protein ES332_D12G091700v1 [Gossypium tomentosum]|uniref:Uncharacterized protein n=1 Tax=Gossypium tomentosum TaxID=34277 RepID=A0A5D2I6I5_GOSTO|nr:hypothetical protein ES332_D12G091700v1 [Gossypium tomentosum]